MKKKKEYIIAGSLLSLAIVGMVFAYNTESGDKKSQEKEEPQHLRRMSASRISINLMRRMPKKRISYPVSGIVSAILMHTRLILTGTEVILEMSISSLLPM